MVEAVVHMSDVSWTHEINAPIGLDRRDGQV